MFSGFKFNSFTKNLQEIKTILLPVQSLVSLSSQRYKFVKKVSALLNEMIVF